MNPPTTIYYAPGVAGAKNRHGLFLNLKGIKSAAKTRANWRFSTSDEQVWEGTVTWRPVDPETGEPLEQATRTWDAAE